jgi:Putative peptidoglycan binding domain
MSLPTEPNRSTPSSLRRGDTGWPVYALQRGLAIGADGIFGPATESAVETYQAHAGLTADGVAGAKTQAALVRALDTATHAAHPSLPAGLLRGFADTESGANLGAVNWSIAGGVDCGVVQIRVYGPPYDVGAMKSAYAPAGALDKVAADFLTRTDTYRAMAYAARHPAEFAQRCAALAWNWPFAAEQYAKFGGLPDPNKVASWVPDGIKFPDGAFVVTWRDWAQFYAMGGPHGEGRVTRYVTSW